MNRQSEPLPPVERRTLAAFALLSLVLRAAAYFRYRFDSDEPQHLHVTWGWTAGMVQYRDYFDNHAPLFHMASAPILALFGERPDILLYMRAPMLLLWITVLGCTWILARRFWCREIAIGAVFLLAIYPPFFLKSLEYRTDNAWNALCLVALVVLTGGNPASERRASTARMFVTGFVLGVALSVSMKTSLLVVSLVLAALATAFALRQRVALAGAVRAALAFACGFVIVPGLVSAFFISRGAWDELLYCVFRFNEFIAATHGGLGIPLRLLYPAGMFLLMRYARHVALPEHDDDTGRQRLFLAMLLGVYIVTLGTFWVLISQRDVLPMMPLAAIFAASWIRARFSGPRRRAAAFAMVATACFVGIGHYTAWLADGTAWHITMMNQALRLSRPGEPLMDYKGETVYRKRPFYYVFETITREAMSKGLIADTIAEDVMKANCHVAQADGPFWPPRSRAFLSANFLDMGRLRAAGQWIQPDGSFSIALPGGYVVVGLDGPVAGSIDGMPLRGPRILTRGGHRFKGVPGERLAVLWAPAFARGFSPFHLKDRDF